MPQLDQESRDSRQSIARVRVGISRARSNCAFPATSQGCLRFQYQENDFAQRKELLKKVLVARRAMVMSIWI
jgi:hypothetical protein